MLRPVTFSPFNEPLFWQVSEVRAVSLDTSSVPVKPFLLKSSLVIRLGVVVSSHTTKFAAAQLAGSSGVADRLLVLMIVLITATSPS